jgi:Flp pilus assembly protein TadD
MWMSWANYPAPAIAIQKYQQIQTSETPSHSFSVGLVPIEVPAESLLILENVFANPIQFDAAAHYLFLAGLALVFIFSASIISTLSRFWFLIGSGILILFIASLRLDILEIFGATGKIPFIGFTLLVIVPVYYFHSFKTDTSLPFRIGFSFILTLVIGALMYFFSRAGEPLLHVAVNGLIAGMIISTLFMLLIAHEIIAFFLWIVSQSGTQGKSFQHFLFLSTIYILNLCLAYATKMGFIHWNLWTVNPFILFTISAVFGVWGFLHRKSMYEAVFDSEVPATYFYLSLVILALGTFTIFNTTASDLMFDGMQDIILYSHLGYGLIFIFYIIINFGPLLTKNLPAHKVVYKPEVMPYFTFRLMGLIATFICLVFASNWKRYINEGTATYYSVYGDLYLHNGDTTTAQGYYQKSLRFRNQNHHAHYALANLAASRFDATTERDEYNKLILLTPTPADFLNLSQAYTMNGDVLQAALTLDEAVKKFPDNGLLQNAKGLSMLQLKQTDSSFYFFRKAANSRNGKESGQTNYMAACAIFKATTAADSILSNRDFKNSGAIINALALANFQNRVLPLAPEKKNDTTLSVYDAAWLSNYFINQKEKIDTSLLAYAEKLVNKEVNYDFKEHILFAAAQAWYARGEVKRATETVRNLAYGTSEGKYFNQLGLWLLEQRNPTLAAYYLKIAFEKKHPNTMFHLAIANTEADSLNNAVKNWDSLKNSKNTFQKEFALSMSKVLRAKAADPAFTDMEKYYFCRHKIGLIDSSMLNQVATSITDNKIQAQVYLDFAQKWFDLDEASVAESFLRKAQSLNVTGLQNEITRLQFLLTADQHNLEWIKTNLNENTPLSFNERIYVEALLNESEGNTAAAKSKFTYLAHANMQFEDALLASSRFFAADSTDRLKPYSILVDGLLAKPYSIKLLKLHVLEAALLGFDDEAQSSLQKLQTTLPRNLYKKFVSSHPDFFSIENN